MAIIGPVGNKTTARAYSQRGHGNKASRSKGRIHISDFQRTCITGIANSSRYIHGGSAETFAAICTKVSFTTFQNLGYSSLIRCTEFSESNQWAASDNNDPNVKHS